MLNRHIEESISRETKVNTASDYYKAVFGVRPKLPPVVSDDVLVSIWATAANEMEKRKSTVEGRNKLRSDGWFLGGDPDAHFREVNPT